MKAWTPIVLFDVSQDFLMTLGSFWAISDTWIEMKIKVSCLEE